MNDTRYQTAQSLLRSDDPDDLRRGLRLVRQELAMATAQELQRFVELVTPLFYVDPLDRPDLASVLDEAISVVAGAGEAVIPHLVGMLDVGDLKAQIACGQALGRIGTKAISPLVEHYHSSEDATRRSLILYALGKIRSPEIVRAAPIALQASSSRSAELRDTALRTIGKLAEAIPAGMLDERLRAALVIELTANAASPRAHLRAKAVRSLGKLARYSHLRENEIDGVVQVCRRILGLDEQEWDRVYLVRKEAEEALRHCLARAGEPVPSV